MTLPDSLPSSLLPDSLLKLARVHTIIDNIFCFFYKRKLAVTLNRLALLYDGINQSSNNIAGSNNNDHTIVMTDGNNNKYCTSIGSNSNNSFNIRDFEYLLTLNPTLYSIQNNNDSISNSISNDIELVFLVYSSSSKKDIKSRKNIVLENITNILLIEYNKQLVSINSNNDNSLDLDAFVKSVKKNGLPHWFSADNIVRNINTSTLDNDTKALLQLFKQQHNNNSNNSNSNLSQSKSIGNNIADGNSNISDTDENDSKAISLTNQSYTSNATDKKPILFGAEGILQYLKDSEFYSGQIVHIEYIKAKEPEYGTLNPPCLPKELQHRLDIITNNNKLFKHQALGINALRAGQHLSISTATASGKSLIYNTPIIEQILQDNRKTALYMFPTKALAQDQLRSLDSMVGEQGAELSSRLPVNVAVCDGDTSFAERAIIQRSEIPVNIILTNPDMLHCTLLPDHNKWRRIYENLKFIVIDEAHQYKGAFGSHVAAVLRRLIRICLFHGSCPQFICCSATIANPAEHMRKLVPIDLLATIAEPIRYQHSNSALTVIDASQDGAPTGDRTFVIWNPPLRSPQKENPQTSCPPPSNTNSASTRVTSLDSIERLNGNDNIDKSKKWCFEEGDTVAAAVLEQTTSASTSRFPKSPVEKSPQTFKRQQFLNGVAETRPPTIGPTRAFILKVAAKNTQSNSTPSPIIGEVLEAASKALQVNYVGGWKRRKKISSKQLEKKLNEESQPNCIPSNDGDQSMASTTVVGGRLEATNFKRIYQFDEGVPTPTYRLSTICETANLFSALVKKKVRTLAFCKVRKLVELVLGYSQRNLEKSGAANLKDYISSYRGGYTKQERRAIEHELFSGKLIGVTTTCALELGIDIGCLDATLHMGFPSSFSSLWQQAGRAGRSGRSSLSIMVCFECPIDQYFARNPNVLFHSPPEPAILDVDNVHILRSHLLCSAKEVPLNYPFQSVFNSFNNGSNTVKNFDSLLWGNQYWDLLQYLVEHDKFAAVRFTNDNNNKDMKSTESREDMAIRSFLENRMWSLRCSASNPIKEVSLRMIDPITISIIDDSRGVVIDSLGYSRAFYELYEGAIYIHRANRYLVVKLDLVAQTAHTKPVNFNYYTSARNKTTVEITKAIEIDSSNMMGYGFAQIVASVYGYRKHALGTGAVFDFGECSLPPLEYSSLAFWIDLPLRIKLTLEAEHLCPIASMHAANHLFVSLCPLYAQCDDSDLGTEHVIARTKLEHPFRMLVYDKRTGGLGACNALYNVRKEVVRRALQVITSCPCATGCPSCVLDPRCTNYNRDLSKVGAKRLLELLIETHQERHCNSATDSSVVPPYYHQGIRNNSNHSNKISSDNYQIRESDVSPGISKRKRRINDTVLRDTARAQRMALQIQWTDSIPTFIQENNN